MVLSDSQDRERKVDPDVSNNKYKGRSATPAIPKIDLSGLNRKEEEDDEDLTFKKLQELHQMARMGRSTVTKIQQERLIKQGTARTIGDLGLQLLAGFSTSRQVQQQNYRTQKSTKRKHDSILTNTPRNYI